MTDVLVDSGHVELINDVAVDFYGARFATASSDGSVRIFEVAKQSTQPQSPVYNQDGSVQQQPQESAQPSLLSSLMLHEGPAFKLSWAHPSFGALLASAGYDGKLIILADQGNGQGWDVLHFIEGTSPIVTVEFIPSEYGLGLVYGCCDGYLHFLLWSDESFQWSQISTFAHQGGVYSISFAPQLISTNGNSSATHNSNVAAQSATDSPARQHHHSLYFNSNSFQHRNMIHFVTAGHDNCAKVWNFDLLTYKQQFQQNSIQSQAPMLITPTAHHTGLLPPLVTASNAHQQQKQGDFVQYDQSGNPTGTQQTQSGYGPFFTIDHNGLLSSIILSDRISTTGFIVNPNANGSAGGISGAIHPTNDLLLENALTTHKGPVRSVLWIPTITNNTNNAIATIVTCSDDGYVSFWSLQSQSTIGASKSPPPHGAAQNATSSSPHAVNQANFDPNTDVPIAAKVKNVRPDEAPYRLALSTDGTIVSVVVGTDSILLYSQTNNYNIYDPDGVATQTGNVGESDPNSAVGKKSTTAPSDWVLVDTLHGIEYINTQVQMIKEHIAFEKKEAEEAAKRAAEEAARKAAEEAEQLRQQQAAAAAEALRQQQLLQQQQLQQQAQQLQQAQQAQQNQMYQQQQSNQQGQYGLSNQQYGQQQANQGQFNQHNPQGQAKPMNQYGGQYGQPNQPQQYRQNPQMNQQHSVAPTNQYNPQQYNQPPVQQYNQPPQNQYNPTPQAVPQNQPQYNQFAQNQPPAQQYGNQQPQYNQYNQPQYGNQQGYYQ